MPVRARRNRRRLLVGSEQWAGVFASEFDFFGDLSDAGVKLDAYGRPSRKEAHEAWQRYGSEFLAGFNGSHIPWALTEFGEPR